MAAIALTIVFTVFAVSVLSYVSLAVMIGPWIDPTLALCGLALLSTCAWFSWSIFSRSSMLLVVAAASMGGLIASAAVWSIPTLYFLDAQYFTSLIQQPVYFMTGIALLVLAAGNVGMLVARCSSFVWRDTHQYAFPIAQLVVRTLTVFGNWYQLLLLGAGAMSALLFHAMQLVRWGIPHSIHITKQRLINAWICVPHIALNMSTAPMLWAVGFIAGNILVVPLLVGVGIKILLMEPCYRVWFSLQVSEQNFATAFCTGLIIQGTIHSFWKLLLSWFAPSTRMGAVHKITRYINIWSSYVTLRSLGWHVLYVVCCALLVLKYVAGLSLLSSMYVLAATAVCCYQLILLMGRIGLATLGRFATFVMVPGLLLFRFNALQATVVAAFVELAGAVAASAASGMRIAMSVDHDDADEVISSYQYLALWISAVVVGIVLWLFARHFGFGGAPLFAQRAQSRALLISAHEMHIGVLCGGMLVGFLLQAVNVNTTLLLGGILMSTSDTLMLIAGGALSHLCRDPKKFEPFWSGVFTASSLWMMSRILL